MTAGQAKPLRGRAKLDSLQGEVLKAIEEGLSGRQLAQRFRVAENTVHRWLKAGCLTLSPLTKLQQQIIALWDATDLNMRAVSRKLDCSRFAVVSTLRKTGRIAGAPGKIGRPPGCHDGKRPPRPKNGENKPGNVNVTYLYSCRFPKNKVR